MNLCASIIGEQNLEIKRGIFYVFSRTHSILHHIMLCSIEYSKKALESQSSWLQSLTWKKKSMENECTQVRGGMWRNSASWTTSNEKTGRDRNSLRLPQWVPCDAESNILAKTWMMVPLTQLGPSVILCRSHLIGLLKLSKTEYVIWL